MSWYVVYALPVPSDAGRLPVRWRSSNSFSSRERAEQFARLLGYAVRTTVVEATSPQGALAMVAGQQRRDAT